MNGEILLVEDHDDTRVLLRDALTAHDFRVLLARNGREALAILEQDGVDLILSDYRMRPVNGLELLAAVRRSSDLPFVLYSAGADAESIFRAGKAGAFLFLEYPFRIDEQLIPAIAEGLAARRAPAAASQPRGAARLVGTSTALHRVREVVRRIARTSSPVLITGETGTGKEEAARAIHEESERGKLLTLSLPELAESVVESELFGHARGAFTGAIDNRAGLLEQASGGTLFLDEIGDAMPTVQAKLLRALETGEIRRLGTAELRRVDTRVICATHRDLAREVAAGTFRQDLYYRVRQFVIHIPPLRERPGDIEPISRHLLSLIAPEAHLPIPETTDEFLGFIRRQPWPGNVRELRSFLQNAILAWDGSSPLDRRDAANALSSLSSDLSPEEQLTCQRMLEACRRNGWNQEAARRELELSRGAWRYRWRRFGLDALGRRRH